MGLSMFSSQPPPIAIDFGSSSVKLLQMSPGDPSKIAAAAELQIPDEARRDSKQSKVNVQAPCKDGLTPVIPRFPLGRT